MRSLLLPAFLLTSACFAAVESRGSLEPSSSFRIPKNVQRTQEEYSDFRFPDSLVEAKGKPGTTGIGKLFPAKGASDGASMSRWERVKSWRAAASTGAKKKYLFVKGTVEKEKEKRPFMFALAKASAKVGTRALIAVATAGLSEVLEQAYVAGKVAATTLKDIYEWGVTLKEIKNSRLTAAAKLACAAHSGTGMITAVIEDGMTTFVAEELGVDDLKAAVERAAESAKEGAQMTASQIVDNFYNGHTDSSEEPEEVHHDVLSHLHGLGESDEFVKTVADKRKEILDKGDDELYQEVIQNAQAKAEQKEQQITDNIAKRMLEKMKAFIGFDCEKLCMLHKLTDAEKVVAEAAGSKETETTCDIPGTFRVGKYRCQQGEQDQTNTAENPVTGTVGQRRNAMTCAKEEGGGGDDDDFDELAEEVVDFTAETFGAFPEE